MTPDTRHLWRRGDQWYFRMPVPRPLQRRILSENGKPMRLIVKALGDSKEQARRKRDRLVVICGDLFDRAKAGETITSDQIKAHVSLDLGAVAERARRAVFEPDPNPMPEPPADLKAYRATKPELTEDDRPPDEEDELAFQVDAVAEREGISIERGTPLWRAVAQAIARGRAEGEADIMRRVLARVGERSAPALADAPLPVEPPASETVSQAAEAWFSEMQRDPSAAVKPDTLNGHRFRVRAFVEQVGDIPLADVTRAMASDFLTAISQQGKANRTTNAYATTMAGVFKSATYRGRFTGNNPFDGQKRKAGGESYEPFTVPELQTLFDSFKFEIAPKHTPETALPWVSLIAAYTGMRLEEIAQLSAADVRDQGANGATVTVIDIHNSDSNTLKNESSARLVPVHSKLVQTGLLEYVKALPKDSLLFPGLARRASKGNKIGARLGELFRKKLEALGLKRERLCFHSFRHTVAEALEAAAVSQTDAARVLGHTIPQMSYGVYSSGPGLKRLAGVVEQIAYPGLKLPTCTSKSVGD